MQFMHVQLCFASDYPDSSWIQAKLAKQGYPLMSNADYKAGFCEPTSEWIMGSYGDASEKTGIGLMVSRVLVMVTMQQQKV